MGRWCLRGSLSTILLPPGGDGHIELFTKRSNEMSHPRGCIEYSLKWSGYLPQRDRVATCPFDFWPSQTAWWHQWNFAWHEPDFVTTGLCSRLIIHKESDDAICISAIAIDVIMPIIILLSITLLSQGFQLDEVEYVKHVLKSFFACR